MASFQEQLGRIAIKFGNYLTGSSDSGVYDSPNDNNGRKARGRLNRDFSEMLSDSTWVKMIEDCRFIARLPLASATLNEKSRLITSGGFKPIYTGTDKDWGNKATQLLHRNRQNVDVRGFANSFCANYERACIGQSRDGAIYRLNVSGKNGFPLSQWLEAHRIGSRGKKLVSEGPYAGLRLVNGHVLSPTGRTVAYNVLGNTMMEDQIIPARFITCITNPRSPSEVRSWPELAPAVLTLWDVAEFRQYEAMKQKIASSITAVEETPTGMAAGPQKKRPAQSGTADQYQTLSDESIVGGLWRYVKKGAGNLIFPKTDTPSIDTREFTKELEMQAVVGMGFRVDYFDNTGKNSAANHAAAAQINNIVAYGFTQIMPYALAEIHWRISSHIARGDLEPNDTWMEWSFLPPLKYTPNPSRTTALKLKEYEYGLISEDDYTMEIYGMPAREVALRRANYLLQEDEILASTQVDPMDFYNKNRFDRRMRQREVNRIAEQDLEELEEVSNDE